MSIATVTPIEKTKPATTRKPRPTATERELAKLQAAAEQRADKARRAMRVIAAIGAGIVWFIDLYASYFHGVHLAIEHHQSQSLAHMFPISVDGYMLVAAVASIALGHNVPWYRNGAKLAFLAGAMVTVLMNVLSVQGFDPIGYGEAGWTAISLIGTAEFLLRLWLPTPVRARRR